MSACTITGARNVSIGRDSGKKLHDGSWNVFMGYHTGCCVGNGGCNVLLGSCAGDSITSGSCNVVIGKNADVASATGDAQFVIGVVGSHWMCGDSSFIHFEQDGKIIGFHPDSQENLYAGTNAGAASDADTCYNIAMGYDAGRKVNEGDWNVMLGHLSLIHI